MGVEASGKLYNYKILQQNTFENLMKPCKYFSRKGLVACGETFYFRKKVAFTLSAKVIEYIIYHENVTPSQDERYGLVLDICWETVCVCVCVCGCT